MAADLLCFSFTRTITLIRIDVPESVEQIREKCRFRNFDGDGKTCMKNEDNNNLIFENSDNGRSNRNGNGAYGTPYTVHHTPYTVHRSYFETFLKALGNQQNVNRC